MLALPLSYTPVRACLLGPTPCAQGEAKGKQGAPSSIHMNIPTLLPPALLLPALSSPHLFLCAAGTDGEGRSPPEEDRGKLTVCLPHRDLEGRSFDPGEPAALLPGHGFVEGRLP